MVYPAPKSSFVNSRPPSSGWGVRVVVRSDGLERGMLRKALDQPDRDVSREAPAVSSKGLETLLL